MSKQIETNITESSINKNRRNIICPITGDFLICVGHEKNVMDIHIMNQNFI